MSAGWTIPYHKQVEVEERVFEALGTICKNKKTEQYIFDKIDVSIANWLKINHLLIICSKESLITSNLSIDNYWWENCKKNTFFMTADGLGQRLAAKRNQFPNNISPFEVVQSVHRIPKAVNRLHGSWFINWTKSMANRTTTLIDININTFSEKKKDAGL